MAKAKYNFWAIIANGNCRQALLGSGKYTVSLVFSAKAEAKRFLKDHQHQDAVADAKIIKVGIQSKQ